MRNEMNKELHEHVQANKEDLITPSRAFVTMQYEKGYNTILTMETIPLFGESIPTTEAYAPSNIQFGHFDIDPWAKRFWATFIVCFTLLIFGVMSGLTMLLRNTMVGLSSKYASADCDGVIAAFSPTMLAKKASDEWYHYYGSKSAPKVSAMVSCFCD